MDVLNPYWLIIAGSVIIILSYGFTLLSQKTSIPSVLLLIGTGILLQFLIRFTGYSFPDFSLILEILGVIGLIMIVLEASLDIDLDREHRKLVWKSVGLAFLSLIITATLISLVFVIYLGKEISTALIYAVPLSIISSAIVIPSTGSLNREKKEFMVYESTFSDIMGIMVFYFILEGTKSETVGELSMHIVFNLVVTVLMSFVISYVLVFIFQKIKTELKLFLLISVLILLYSVAKLMHFSSLLLILVFGLVLKNEKFFFRGQFKYLLDHDTLKEIQQNFRLVTLESAFVVRTFFFVIFGISVVLSSLLELEVLSISLIILVIIYSIRFLVLKILKIKSILPELFLAPRGLITILLYYAIPPDLRAEEFDTGILLFVILFTSIAMTFSLINYKSRQALELEFPGPGSKNENQLEDGKEMKGRINKKADNKDVNGE